MVVGSLAKAMLPQAKRVARATLGEGASAEAVEASAKITSQAAAKQLLHTLVAHASASEINLQALRSQVPPVLLVEALNGDAEARKVLVWHPAEPVLTLKSLGSLLDRLKALGKWNCLLYTSDAADE